MSQANRTGTAGLTEISASEIPRQFIIRTQREMDVPSFIFVGYKSLGRIIFRAIHFFEEREKCAERKREGARSRRSQISNGILLECSEDYRYNEIDVFFFQDPTRCEERNNSDHSVCLRLD